MIVSESSTCARTMAFWDPSVAIPRNPLFRKRGSRNFCFPREEGVDYFVFRSEEVLALGEMLMNR